MLTSRPTDTERRGNPRTGMQSEINPAVVCACVYVCVYACVSVNMRYEVACGQRRARTRQTQSRESINETVYMAHKSSHAKGCMFTTRPYRNRCREVRKPRNHFYNNKSPHKIKQNKKIPQDFQAPSTIHEKAYTRHTQVIHTHTFRKRKKRSFALIK